MRAEMSAVDSAFTGANSTQKTPMSDASNGLVFDMLLQAMGGMMNGVPSLAQESLDAKASTKVEGVSSAGPAAKGLDTLGSLFSRVANPSFKGSEITSASNPHTVGQPALTPASEDSSSQALANVSAVGANLSTANVVEPSGRAASLHVTQTSLSPNSLLAIGPSGVIGSSLGVNPSTTAITERFIQLGHKDSESLGFSNDKPENASQVILAGRLPEVGQVTNTTPTPRVAHALDHSSSTMTVRSTEVSSGDIQNVSSWMAQLVHHGIDFKTVKTEQKLAVANDSVGNGHDLPRSSALNSESSIALQPSLNTGTGSSDGLQTELDVRDPNAVQNFAALLSGQIQSGTNNMQVHVRPEGMGDILISISKQEGGMQVHIEANNAQTMAWMQQGTEQVTSSLAKAGIDLQTLSVSYGQASLTNGFSNSSNQQNGRGNHSRQSENGRGMLSIDSSDLTVVSRGVGSVSPDVRAKYFTAQA